MSNDKEQRNWKEVLIAYANSSIVRNKIRRRLGFPAIKLKKRPRQQTE